jgi:hypothetical protein
MQGSSSNTSWGVNPSPNAPKNEAFASLVDWNNQKKPGTPQLTAAQFNAQQQANKAAAVPTGASGMGASGASYAAKPNYTPSYISSSSSQNTSQSNNLFQQTKSPSPAPFGQALNSSPAPKPTIATTGHKGSGVDMFEALLPSNMIRSNTPDNVMCTLLFKG